MSKDVDIVVNCTRKGPGAFGFDMVRDNHKTDRLEFDKKKDGLKKNEHYDVQFTIRNHNGARLRFVRDEAIVMWTKTGDNGCPTHDEYQGPEFAVKDVKDSKLWIRNRDDTREKYKFVLNFVDEETNALVSYDPIWDNRNGGL